MSTHGLTTVPCFARLRPHRLVSSGAMRRIREGVNLRFPDLASSLHNTLPHKEQCNNEEACASA